MRAYFFFLFLRYASAASPPPHAAPNDATDAIQASFTAFEEAFWEKVREEREGHEFKKYFEKWLSGFKTLQSSARESKRSAQSFLDHIAHLYVPFIAAGYKVLKRETDANDIKANILANAFISGLEIDRRSVENIGAGIVEHPAIAIGRAVNQFNSVLVKDSFKISPELVQAALSKMSSSQIGEFAKILTKKLQESLSGPVKKFLPYELGSRLRKYLERIRDDKRPLDLIFANTWSKTLEDYLNEKVVVDNYFPPLIHRQTCRETFIEGANTDITEELQRYADRMEKLNQKMAKFIGDFATKVPVDNQNRIIPLLHLVLVNCYPEKVATWEQADTWWQSWVAWITKMWMNQLIVVPKPKNDALLEAFIEAGYCVIQRESDVTRILEHMFANIVISGLKFDQEALASDLGLSTESWVVQMGKALAEMNENADFKGRKITAELVQVAMSKMSEAERAQFEEGIPNLLGTYNEATESDQKIKQGDNYKPGTIPKENTLPVSVILKLRRLLEKIVYDPTKRRVAQIFGIPDDRAPIADLIAHAVHPNWRYKYALVPE